MFYGDLISNLFLRTLTASNSSGTTSLCSAAETASLRNNTLPKILTPWKVKACSPTSPPLLSFDFNDPDNFLGFKSEHEGNISYLISPLNATSWELVEDRPNKFGLVSEFTNDGRDEHSIRWYLDIMPTLKEYRLSIRYMRTYLNAGVIFML